MIICLYYIHHIVSSKGSSWSFNFCQSMPIWFYCYFIKSTAAEVLAIVRENLKDKKIYLTHDVANKGSMHHIVKKIGAFDVPGNKFDVILRFRLL